MSGKTVAGADFQIIGTILQAVTIRLHTSAKAASWDLSDDW
jgi:hypothetical protein